jgi:EmrB/QacA subfamily drug resistance transporter
MAEPTLAPARIRLIFSGLALALFLAALDQSVVATALPTIVTEFGGIEHIAWIVTAYLAAVCVSTPLFGKLGDSYGRRSIFLVSVTTFIVGSMLSGLAQSMDQLIAFRAVQGIGAGGLLSVTVAMSADIVSPRELGRYQGYFAASFGAATILGPLVGGFFTEHLSWRWIFYINLPVGAVTLAIIAFAFRVPVPPHRRRFDLLGSVMLAAAILCIVMVTSWGGSQYAWRSPVILGLGAAAVVATLLFLAAERRAGDPVLPLGLFRDSTFSIASATSFFVGFGLFGAIAFLPLFLQVVYGASPINSGLLLLPMMFGLLVAVVMSGVIITKTGRYKVFAVSGPAIAAIGMYLLSTIGPATARTPTALYTVIVGVGIGLCLQVLVLIAQNTAPPQLLGVTTSSVAFIRTIGGAVGVAVLGAVFTNRLTTELTRFLPANASIDIPKGSAGAVPTEALAALPPEVRSRYIVAFATALTDAYLWTVPALVAAALIAVMLRHVPMRQHVPAADPGAAPSAPESR